MTRGRIGPAVFRVRRWWWLVVCCCHWAAAGEGLPAGFVRADAALPGARLDPKYATADNFTGAPVPGYLAPTVVLSAELASALAGALAEANADGLTFILYDGYRPQSATRHFLRWAAAPDDDPVRRAAHYPGIARRGDLFRLGFLSEKSGHSRGTMVDLTLARADSGEPLDMGGNFDVFDERARYDAPELSETARENRRRLRTLMERHGLKGYDPEWWHFGLAHDPRGGRYFNFPVQ